MSMTRNSGKFYSWRTENARFYTLMAIQTWTGRPVKTELLPLRLINSNQLPTFKRENFEGDNGAMNPHLDVILNEACGTPVATVSKNYSLIQHQDAIQTTIDTLDLLGYTTDNTECELTWTKLGERIWLRIRFQDHSFDPGDGYPMFLELSIFNSVDGSLVFGFEGGWYRQICANGMVALAHGISTNKRHSKSLTTEFLAQQLKQVLDSTLSEQETYKSWKERKVIVGQPFRYTQRALEDWLDETVTKEWGRRTAARAYHIIRTGKDGKPDIGSANKKLPSYKIPVSPGQEIPGAKPSENILDVNHALTWISSHQETIQTRHEMMNDIPKLIRNLSQESQNS